MTEDSKLLKHLKGIGVSPVETEKIERRVTWGVVDKFEAYHGLCAVLDYWAKNGVEMDKSYTLDLHHLSAKDNKELDRYLAGSKRRSHYKLNQAFNESLRRYIKQNDRLHGKVYVRISINDDTVTIMPDTMRPNSAYHKRRKAA